jgi:hypothetical protein
LVRLMNDKGTRVIPKLSMLWIIVLIACAGAVCLPRLTLRDSIAILRLRDCTLPCWIGIIPGQTTIGQARKLIQDTYGREFDVEIVETNKDYTLAYVLRVSAKDRSNFMLVALNNWATEMQGDDSVVQEIELYPPSTVENGHVPTVVDMILKLGRPKCMAAEFGNHTSWPIMLYPQYQAKLSFGKSDFEVAPYLPAGLIISDRSLICDNKAVAWRGFNKDYRQQFLESMLP